MRLAACAFMGLYILKRRVSSLNILAWGVVLCCHAACKNFAGLFVVRLILGICEGSITAGFMIVSSMFYTRKEHTARVGYWCKDCLTLFYSRSNSLTVLMNGTGSKVKSLYLYAYSQMLQLKFLLVSSALASCTYIHQGLSHGNGTTRFNISPIYLSPSRLMVITGSLTIIMAVAFLWAPPPSRGPFIYSRICSFLFPDSPTNAWFLTEDERAKAVRRIKVCNRSSSYILGLSMYNEGKPNGN